MSTAGASSSSLSARSRPPVSPRNKQPQTPQVRVVSCVSCVVCCVLTWSCESRRARPERGPRRAPAQSFRRTTRCTRRQVLGTSPLLYIFVPFIYLLVECAGGADHSNQAAVQSEDDGWDSRATEDLMFDEGSPYASSPTGTE
jgi:hypothetical protein